LPSSALYFTDGFLYCGGAWYQVKRPASMAAQTAHLACRSLIRVILLWWRIVILLLRWNLRLLLLVILLVIIEIKIISVEFASWRLQITDPWHSSQKLIVVNLFLVDGTYWSLVSGKLLIGYSLICDGLIWVHWSNWAEIGKWFWVKAGLNC